MNEHGSTTTWVLGLIGAVVLVIVLAYVGVFGVGLFKRSTADFRGQTGVIERTRANADFRIQAYEHFFDQCAAVQTLDQTLRATTDEIATSTDSTDHERLQINLTGLRAERARAQNQYNADARKSWTGGQFRSADLPYQLPDYETGEVISCR